MFAVAHLVFGIPLPAHPLGFLAAIAAGTSAVFALGLVIAAVAGPHGHRCRNGSVPAGDVLRRGLPAEVPVARRRAAHRRVRPAGVAALDDAWLGVRLHHPASSTAVATLSQCDELAEIVALMDPAYAIRFTDAFGDSTVTSAHDGVQLVVA